MRLMFAGSKCDLPKEAMKMMPSKSESEGQADVGLPTADEPPTLRRELEDSDLIPIDTFGEAQSLQVAQISASVSLDDSASTEFFAAPPMKRLSEQIERTLGGIRTDELGDRGSQIILSVRKDFASLRLDKVRDEIRGKRGLLARLPLVGEYFSAFQRMRAMHKPVLAHLDQTRRDAEILLGKLKSVLAVSDQQYQATEEAIDEFALWLAGGQRAWLRMRDEYRDEFEAASRTRDHKRLASLRDRAESLDSFAAILVDLRIAHLGFIASLPQIRMAQKAARIEVQNTLRAIFMDLPRIKQAVRTMASLRQIAQASESAKAQKQMAQDLARLSADMTGAVYTAALASEGDFDGGVQTLDYVINTVVGTIDRGLAIREENVAKRDAAVQAVNAAHARFVNSLHASANRGLTSTLR